MNWSPSGPFIICCSCGGMKNRALTIVQRACPGIVCPIYTGKEIHSLGIREWMKETGFLEVLEKSVTGTYAFLISPEKHGSVNLLSSDKLTTAEGIQYVFDKE